MPSLLETCPNEVVQGIAELLSLDDLCSLRLTSRALADASHYRFRAFFERKNVDVTTASLQKFAQAVRCGGPPSHIRNLYLTGVAYQASRKVPRTKRDIIDEEGDLLKQVDILVQAFNGLSRSNTDATIASISLRVAVICVDGKRVLPSHTAGFAISKKVWRSAFNTFDVAMRALGKSKLRIKYLDIFNEEDMQQCSLGCEQLNAIDWNSAGIADSLANLQFLSISVSTPSWVLGFRRMTYEEDNDDAWIVSPSLMGMSNRQVTDSAEAAMNFVGLAKLYSLCPRLQGFNLHYLAKYAKTTVPITTLIFADIIGPIVLQEKLPPLETIIFRGFATKESTLLDFIKRSNASQVRLETIRLSSGSFAPIFNCCTQTSTKMTTLYLDYLWEGTNLVRFHGRKCSRLPLGNRATSERLQRHRSAIRGSINSYITACQLHYTPSIAVADFF